MPCLPYAMPTICHAYLSWVVETVEHTYNPVLIGMWQHVAQLLLTDVEASSQIALLHNHARNCEKARIGWVFLLKGSEHDSDTYLSITPAALSLNRLWCQDSEHKEKYRCETEWFFRHTTCVESCHMAQDARVSLHTSKKRTLEGGTGADWAEMAMRQETNA